MRTPRSAGAHAWILASVPALTALALAAACTASGPESEPASRPSEPATKAATDPAIEAFARSILARFPAAFVEPGAPASPAVTLPRAANEPLRLHDAETKFDLVVALDGARPIEGSEAAGLVVYRGAAPGEGDLVHRRVAEGVEDLVLFERSPGRESLDYVLQLRPSERAPRGVVAAGLRLVSNVLEVLDRHGTPLFRARAPYVLDASGRHEATLSVEGCAVDTSPAAPFGRAVVAPGRDACTVKVDWSAARVRYPALVDPVWGNTFNAMATPRSHHTITLLNPSDPKSLALVTGGAAVVGGAPLKAAEIYDPLSRRFSSTDDMNVARTAHTATLISTVGSPGGFVPQQPVLIAGGNDAAGNPLASLEVYDPASGTFVNDSHTMATPRFEHAAVLFDDNKILLAGGTSPPLNQPTNTAYIYTFTAFDPGTPPASIQSSLDPSNTLMQSARTGFAMTRTTTGQLLLTGGYVLAGGALQALQSAEIFDPVTGNFGPVVLAGGGVAGMTVQRGYHASTALGDSGKILVTGGLSKTVNGIYTNSADIYDDGSQSGIKGFIPQITPITMATARANHTATLLPDGRVLIAGGFGGTPTPAALNSAELFSPSNNLFTDLGALVPMQARGDHAALLVNAGDSTTAGHSVLVTGGANAPNNGSQAIAGAQLLLRLNGETCTVDDECLSGFCVDDVCCDKACDEECYACSVATKEAGPDGTCGFAKQGADPHVQCINQVETHTQCDGQGSTEQTVDTHSCIPAACGADGFCSPGCNVTGDCDATGWCDTTQPTPGWNGTCAKKKVDGAPCGADDQCDSPQCVDGVCCDAACTGQCQACDIPGLNGKCTKIGAPNDPQDVHPNADGVLSPPRVGCDGFVEGTRTTCTGACSGGDTCSYPDDMTLLHGDECADDPEGGPSTLTKFPCNGLGSFMPDAGDCAGFTCADATTCKTECTTDADCILDFVCTAGQCVKLTGPLCDGIDTLRQPADQGGYVVCPDNYACPAGATACLTSCESVLDCVTHDEANPIVCADVDAAEKQCVPTPAEEPLPGCSVPLENKGDRSALWLAAAGLAWLVSRRRKS